VAATEKPDSEKSGIGENELEMKPLAKIPTAMKSTTSHFSPMEFSPIKSREFSPMKKPAKKVTLKLVGPAKNGQRGRPRNPNLPPAPDKYFYWTKAGNGLKLEKRRSYEYVGFIMPNEWQTLRGIYDEEYILKTILAAIRVKRARPAEGPRHSAGAA